MITPLQQKSYHTLELPKVLELLAAQAVSPQAKERCLALEPEDTLFACQRLQQQTEDAVRLAGLFGSPSFSGVRDVNGALERAGVGGMLNMKELLEIAALLGTHSIKNLGRSRRNGILILHLSGQACAHILSCQCLGWVE